MMWKSTRTIISKPIECVGGPWDGLMRSGLRVVAFTVSTNAFGAARYHSYALLARDDGSEFYEYHGISGVAQGSR